MVGTESGCALCGTALAGSLVMLQIVWPERGRADRVVEVCDACDALVESLIELCARTRRACDEHAAA